MLDIRNVDCMEMMKEFPDKYFDLAIVDPPYGIKADEMTMGRGSKNDLGIFKPKGWDKKIPDQFYFDELKRVSLNQIIWGGNYFNLGPARCYLLWDKMDYNSDFASAELAWTSFDKVVKTFRSSRNDDNYRIHPTQKPIRLYSWILNKYSSKNQKILDTHLGSGSIAIACHYFGCDLTACEIDKDYYESAMKRIAEQTKQIAEQTKQISLF